MKMHIVNTMNITNILVMNINVMKINMDVQEMRQSDIENVIEEMIMAIKLNPNKEIVDIIKKD